ncbi:MAG: penicillin-binding transpeptidase domain-containing protein [Peptoniphilaceae bacterium]
MNNKFGLNKPKRNKKVKVKKNRLTKSKIFLLLSFLAFLFIAIIIKLFYINIVNGEELTRKALNQLTRTETVKAERGIIYDRNKKELAINITRANVYYDMNFDKKKFNSTADYSDYVKKETKKDSIEIAKVLGVETEDVLKLLKGKKMVKIVSNLDRETALKLKDLKIPNLSVEDTENRLYPYNTMASQIIGFTNSDGDGLYGIESKYDEELSGIAGQNISVKNNYRFQIPLTDEKKYAPTEGLNPVLTIDENIQRFAEDAAEKAKEEHDAELVSIIVQDTKTSEILAMTSTGGYDLNNPKNPVGDEQKKDWESLSIDEKTQYWYKNWSNYCISSQYEPGSTFKLITAAAALEENTTYPSKSYYCPGVLTDMNEFKPKFTSNNIGSKTMEQAITESCNITLIKMGRELGKEKLFNYLKAFGFGLKTGIDLPAEATGTIPKSTDDISRVRLATMSYGHGIAVTPIQLINSVSAIANGGYLNTPKIVDRLEDENGNIIKSFKTQTQRRVISEQTSQTMKRLMKNVVEEGTGKLAQIDGYQVGGKTGTAYIASKGGYEDSYNSSFIGVAPINDPKITVLVIVQRPKGKFFAAEVAAPSAKIVMEKSLKYLEIPQTEIVKKKEKDNLVTVPNVKNLLLSDAGKEIIDLGLTFNTNSNSISNISTIVRQNPKAGTSVEAESIIDLYVNDNVSDEKIMPNLIGKKENELISILKELNLEYNINGSGEVLSQSIKPGSKINKSSRVKFKMSISDEKEDELLKKEDNENKDKSKDDLSTNNKLKNSKNDKS